jgi:histidine decarboxylase
MGKKGLKKRYQQSLEVAEYSNNKLTEIGIKAWKNPGSITVIFPKVSDKIKKKWQLATEGDTTHIICMPNVTKNQIDEFVNDLGKS